MFTYNIFIFQYYWVLMWLTFYTELIKICNFTATQNIVILFISIPNLRIFCKLLTNLNSPVELIDIEFFKTSFQLSVSYLILLLFVVKP